MTAEIRPTHRPYPEYKDSGIEWLGDIPAHWDTARVKYLGWFNYGDSLASDSREDGQVPVCGSNGPVGTHSSANTLAPAIIVGRKGSFGKVNFSDEPCFAIDTTYFIDPSSARADIRWLYYALPLLKLDSLSQDSAIPGLSREFAHNQHLPKPPLPEQRTIAAFLDRETARIDALIEKKQRLIDLLQEKRTALISHAVTKGLDPSVPMKDSGVEWLGEIPAHWEVAPLMYLTQQDRPIMYGIVLPGPNVENGVPIVKGGDVAPDRLRLNLLNRTTHEIESKYVRSRLRGNDIVYAIRGSIGMAEIVPHEIEGANLTQDAARVAPRQDLNVQWLLYALKSRSLFAQLDAGAQGATIRGINIKDLKRLRVPVPPQEEQDEIAVMLNKARGKVDNLVHKIYQGVQRLQEYRAVLISAAVTGKIDVRTEVALEVSE